MRVLPVIGADLPGAGVSLPNGSKTADAPEGTSDFVNPILEGVFHLLGQVLDIVRRPILDIHAKVQTHARQHFLDLV